MDKKKITLIIEIVLFIGALCGITFWYYFGGEKSLTVDESESVNIIKITDSNFEDEVLKSDKPVVLEFFSNNCPPCLTMVPTMIDIAKNNPEIKVASANTSEEEVSKTTTTYEIEAYPTIIIFKDGKVHKTLVGATNKETILEEVNK